MTILTIVHHESFAVNLYQWTNNNGEIEMTIPTIVHHESFAVILYQWTNNNGEMKMTILAIVYDVSHLHCYYILTEEQFRTVRLK